LFSAVSIVCVARAVYGADICTTCIEIKLERPIVVRGPSQNEPDAPLSVIQLPSGTFRGFTANATTIAIDGKTPLDLGGPGKTVLEPGSKGSVSECGQWLTTLMPVGGKLFGMIHDERYCNYKLGETQKSMSIAVSHDDGLSWDVLGQIITGDEGNGRGAPGIGDCTAVDGHDHYWYAYCLRQRDWKNIAARAPRDAPTPGKWKEWDGVGWREPGLGGLGSPLIPSAGMNAAYWTRTGTVILLNAADTSLQLSISKNKVDFETLPEPLISYDLINWKRPAPTALYGYPAMIADKGLNDISQKFFLTYLYIPPGQDFTQRYLVMQPGEIVRSSKPPHPQVRTALTRWIDARHETWTTSGPAVLNGQPYSFDRGLGYLMTADPGADGVALDECLSARTGDGFLAPAGKCATGDGLRRRTAGYAFGRQRAGTIALFDCVRNNGARFVSDRADCEKTGTAEHRLGFALR
jgi:hypothetical protein